MNEGFGQLTWDNGGDGVSWSDKANWTGDVLPMPGTDVIIDGDFDVAMNVDGFCASLELNGNSSLTIGGIATLKIENFGGLNYHIKLNSKSYAYQQWIH